MRAYLLIAICVSGCSEGKRVNIAQTVGTSGGMVETGDGTAVNIPAGALGAQANFTIEGVNVIPPSGVKQLGPAYDFGPEGATFSSPVSITIPFDTSRIPAGKTTADVRMYTAPRNSVAFTVVPTVVEAGVLATTTTTHFTTYFPGAATGDGSCAPTCFTSEGCYCSAMCGGKKYELVCSGSSTSFSCFCTIDGQTQDLSPSVTSCTQSNAASAFQICLRPLS
jgi:hypothetical protein